MNGSGKQIFLMILQELSTQVSEPDDASERLRAGMLLHGSSSVDSMRLVDRVSWKDKTDADGDQSSQEISLGEGEGRFLTDLFNDVMWDHELEAFVRSRAPHLSSEQWNDFVTVLWMLVSAVTMQRRSLAVEHRSPVDVDGWVESWRAKLDLFREDPSSWE